MLSAKLPDLEETVWCWRDILTVGLPAAASNMISPISIGVITSFLAVHGAAAVAAFGVASRIESFAMIALGALSASIGPFVGQNWGAKRYGQVTKALNQSYAFCLGWGLLVAGLLGLTAPVLVQLFNQDPVVVDLAVRYLWVVPVSYAGAGLISIASSAFNALGRPVPSIVLTVLRMFVLYIPLAYFGSRWFGPMGIFVGAAIANILVGLAAYFYSRRQCCGKTALATATVLTDSL